MKSNEKRKIESKKGENELAERVQNVKIGIERKLETKNRRKERRKINCDREK